MKEYEYSQEANYEANDTILNKSLWTHLTNNSVRSQIELPEQQFEIEQPQEIVEIVPSYESRFEKEPKDTPTKSVVKSPLPHEVYKNISNDEQIAWNIYNCSPAAEEKRK